MSHDPDRPTPEQLAWIFEALAEELDEPGTLHELVTEKLGYDEETYQLVVSVGGMDLHSAIELASSIEGVTEYYSGESGPTKLPN